MYSTTIKRLFFKALDKIVNRKNATSDIQIDNLQNNDKPYFWCYCTTIGELNACKPLIETIPQQYQLVLITDRHHYTESYLKAFPNAIIVTLSGQLPECNALVNRLPPAQVMLCEIPLRLHDAPCRLSYELLFQAKKLGSTISLVNGWLYHYQPSCRQDAIERKLFEQEYLQLFDIICVQTNEVKSEIEQISTKPLNIHVTGNMKFDALADTSFVIKDEISAKLIELYHSSTKQTLVAGCVSQFEEYDLVIDAYKKALIEKPDLQLVLAPRHPENKGHMAYLTNALKQSLLSFLFKSTLNDLPSSMPQILVLDTVGELKAFYSIADCAYVGKNHNILEPMAFSVPVVVQSGWEKTYPSYPVYQATYHNNLITEINNCNDLAAWLIHPKRRENLDDMQTNLSGSTIQNVKLILEP